MKTKHQEATATVVSEVGKRLKKIRESKGLNQSVLSIRAGLSANAVQKIEAGTTAHPRTDTIEKIEVALGLSPGTLLQGDRGTTTTTTTTKDVAKPAGNDIPPALASFLVSSSADNITEEEMQWLMQARSMDGEEPTIEGYKRLLFVKRVRRGEYSPQKTQ